MRAKVFRLKRGSQTQNPCFEYKGTKVPECKFIFLSGKNKVGSYVMTTVNNSY